MLESSLLGTADYQSAVARTIGDISREWRYEMNRRLKKFGLNLSQRQVLIQLYREKEGMMQRDLARKLGIEGPTLVRLLDRLEEKEWIQRVGRSEDKRRKHAVLTSKAIEQIDIIEKLSWELREKMMKDMSPDELQIGLTILQRIRDNLIR